MAGPGNHEAIDWRGFFAERAGELAALRIAGARDEIAAALAEGGSAALAGLKRYVRELGREAGTGAGGGDEMRAPEPLLVEAALRAAGVDVRGLAGGALLATRMAERGLAEPVVELRAIEIARRVLSRLAEAPADREGLSLAEVTGVPAGKIVAWYLTGLDAPSPSDGEAWTVAGAASAVDDVLAPLGWLGSGTLASRRAVIGAWAAAADRARAARGGDPIEARFFELWREREADVRIARQALAAALRGGDGIARAEGAALGLVARLAAEEDGWPAGAGGLAAFCASAQVVGLLSALPRRDHRLSAYSGAFAHRLVARLPRTLSGQPLSLLGAQVGFLFWRSIVLLVDERRRLSNTGSDIASLLEAAAETGALTRAIADQVGRLVDLVEGAAGSGEGGAAAGRERAVTFAMRLAFAASQKRGLAADRLFRDGVRRAVEVASGGAAAEVRRWWGPVSGAPEPGAAEVLEAVRRCAGRALAEGAGARDCARFWKVAARHLVSDAPGAPWIARVDGWLDRAVAAEAEAAASGAGMESRRGELAASGAAAMSGRTCLAIQELEGRNGEIYLLVRLFGAAESGVTALLGDEHYPRPADASEDMEALAGALDELRTRAASGIATAADVGAVAGAIAALAPRRLWAELAEHVGRAGASVEISAASFGIPWELAPLPGARGEDAPLGLGAVALRRRGGSAVARRAGAGPVRSLLLFYDAEQPGALEEAAALQRLFRGEGRSVRVVGSVEAFRALPADARFDAIHYAGHHGPGSDATPALALGDGRLPLRHLVDRFHDAPPQVLFLNACSTLRPSEQIATGDRRGSTHLVFGPLEALVRSTIPCLVGTLWDVSPPPDPLLVRTFYEALLRGESPASALLAARRAAAALPAWAASWPAYVIAAP